MSLLNDALRKRNFEQSDPGQLPLSISMGKIHREKRRMRRLIAAAIVIATAVAIFLIITWQQSPMDLAAIDYPRITVRPTVDASDAVEPPLAKDGRPPAPLPETPNTDGPVVEKVQGPESTEAPEKRAATDNSSEFEITAAPERLTPPNTKVENEEKRAETIVNKPSGNEGAFAKTITADQKVLTAPLKNPEPKKKVQPPAPPMSPQVEKTLTAEVNNKAVFSQSTDAGALYEKARQYHRRRMLPQAIAMYRQAAAIDPNHFNARFNLTSAYLDDEQYDNALTLATALHRQWPDDPRVVMNLAVAQIGCGRPQMALELMDGIIEHADAPLYEIYFHKGISYRKLDQPAKAVDWYERALKIHGDDPKLLFNMALALDQLQQYASAAGYYRQYLDRAADLDNAIKEQIRNRITVLQTAAQGQRKETGAQ